MRSKDPIRLTAQEREVLEARMRSRSGRADETRRARVVLMLADGETHDGIQEALRCGRAYVARWRERFLEQHNTDAFVAFLESLLARVRGKHKVHVILDNLSVHKSRHVERFLADHPRLHFHFTPTYSSWLNQIEIWLSKIERDVIARGAFTSVKDLARKLMRYIRRYDQHARPIKWHYSDPSYRIHSSALPVTGH
jgi:transposase